MRRVRTLDLLLWSLAGACLLACVALAWGYKGLVDEIADLQARKAMLESNRAITQTALTDLQMMLQQSDPEADALCDKWDRLRRLLLDRSRPGYVSPPDTALNLLINTCSTLEGGAISPERRATRAFVDVYVNAVAARLRADAPAAEAAYRQALDLPDADRVNAQWRMRALEGMATTQAEQGRHAEAQAALDRLETLRVADNARWGADDLFVFADLARIKLMCRRKAPAATVATHLAELRTRYDTYAATRTNAANTAFARKDRRYIEDDEELFVLCRYAGVEPKDVPPG